MVVLFLDYDQILTFCPPSMTETIILPVSPCAERQTISLSGKASLIDFRSLIEAAAYPQDPQYSISMTFTI